MLFDLNKIDTDPFGGKKFDVCICGAGVAGIVLARKLSRRFTVALLEAGDLNYSAESQDIYKGKNIGHEYFPLDRTRLRYFGGTSNVWAGWCRPLDSYDFESKKYLEFSGWPIVRSDLDPYLSETKNILDIPDTGMLKQTGDRFCRAVEKSGTFKAIDFWFSAPTRFGQKYKADIERSRNLACYLNANVTNILLNEGLSTVKEIEVRNYLGRSFRIRARAFVIAAGGIENPRILLNCDRQISGGLGNQADLVGRFFTEHLHYMVGKFILEDTTRNQIFEDWRHRKILGRFFTPSKSFQHTERILNFGLRFEPSPPEEHQMGFHEKLQEMLRTPDTVRNSDQRTSGSKTGYWDGLIRIASEQAPNWSSRITLGKETDRFGWRRVNLDWRLSAIDKHTLRRAVVRFGEIFATRALGRVRVAEWLHSEDAAFPGLRQEEVAGNHHMCTTRMGSSPREGVVDKNHKVFGISNLYMAGSSVFSTAGHANPTFTIVQMTLRLADHLEQL